MSRFVLLSVAGVLAASIAEADTAYIEPSTFTPRLNQTITIEASFNDYCCAPKYPVRSDYYAVIQPDGTLVEPDRIEQFATSTVLEHKIMHQGTTRLTTGERLGRKGGEYALMNGLYVLLNNEDEKPIRVPEDTPILSSQTATVSDSYVTVGAPTWEGVHVPIGRLTITPQQHPSELQVGDGLELVLSFDGNPLADQSVLLTRAGQKDRSEDVGRLFTTDQMGRVSIQLKQVGTHLIMTRKQSPAPIGAETDIRSYTTSLTFDVQKNDE